LIGALTVNEPVILEYLLSDNLILRSLGHPELTQHFSIERKISYKGHLEN